ncbi:MAG: hypothetical protein NTY48_01150 [Candidatus Diapherotrites archaeon]|nr:hypothetical protein [Candidatus Diapherotrites archaeon]
MAKTGVGGYAFLIGFILAIILGVVQGLVPSVIGAAALWVLVVLVILGVIVGLLNIKDKHITEFLIAVIAVTMIGMIPINQLGLASEPVGIFLGAILQSIVAFSAPAALVLGLKQIWVLGSNKS